MIETKRLAPFQVATDQQIDLGDIPVQSVPVLDMLTGRVIDSTTGGPIPSTFDTYTRVTLYRCYNPECSNGMSNVNSASVVDNGVFQITSNQSYQPITSGDYMVVVSALQYETGSFPVYLDATRGTIDLGDLAIQSLPVRFSDVVGCMNVPASGGTCSYSVRLTNGLATTIKPIVWSIVKVDQLGLPYPYPVSSGGVSVFQPEPEQTVVLKSTSSQVVTFSFSIPKGVAERAVICTTAYVSKDRSTRMLETIGQHQLFCLYRNVNGTFVRMNEQQLQRFQNEGKLPR